MSIAGPQLVVVLRPLLQSPAPGGGWGEFTKACALQIGAGREAARLPKSVCAVGHSGSGSGRRQAASREQCQCQLSAVL